MPQQNPWAVVSQTPATQQEKYPVQAPKDPWAVVSQTPGTPASAQQAAAQPKDYSVLHGLEQMVAGPNTALHLALEPANKFPSTTAYLRKLIATPLLNFTNVSPTAVQREDPWSTAVAAAGTGLMTPESLGAMKLFGIFGDAAKGYRAAGDYVNAARLALASRVAAAGFSFTQLPDIVHNMQRYFKARREGHTQEAKTMLGTTGLQTVFAALGGKYAFSDPFADVGPIPTKTEEGLPELKELPDKEDLHKQVDVKAPEEKPFTPQQQADILRKLGIEPRHLAEGADQLDELEKAKPEAQRAEIAPETKAEQKLVTSQPAEESRRIPELASELGEVEASPESQPPDTIASMPAMSAIEQQIPPDMRNQLVQLSNMYQKLQGVSVKMKYGQQKLSVSRIGLPSDINKYNDTFRKGLKAFLNRVKVRAPEAGEAMKNSLMDRLAHIYAIRQGLKQYSDIYQEFNDAQAKNDTPGMMAAAEKLSHIMGFEGIPDLIAQARAHTGWGIGQPGEIKIDRVFNGFTRDFQRQLFGLKSQKKLTPEQLVQLGQITLDTKGRALKSLYNTVGLVFDGERPRIPTDMEKNPLKYIGQSAQEAIRAAQEQVPGKAPRRVKAPAGIPEEDEILRQQIIQQAQAQAAEQAASQAKAGQERVTKFAATKDAATKALSEDLDNYIKSNPSAFPSEEVAAGAKRKGIRAIRDAIEAGHGFLPRGPAESLEEAIQNSPALADLRQLGRQTAHQHARQFVLSEHTKAIQDYMSKLSDEELNKHASNLSMAATEARQFALMEQAKRAQSIKDPDEAHLAAIGATNLPVSVQADLLPPDEDEPPVKTLSPAEHQDYLGALVNHIRNNDHIFTTPEAIAKANEAARNVFNSFISKGMEPSVAFNHALDAAHKFGKKPRGERGAVRLGRHPFFDGSLDSSLHAHQAALAAGLPSGPVVPGKPLPTHGWLTGDGRYWINAEGPGVQSHYDALGVMLGIKPPTDPRLRDSFDERIEPHFRAALSDGWIRISDNNYHFGPVNDSILSRIGDDIMAKHRGYPEDRAFWLQYRLPGRPRDTNIRVSLVDIENYGSFNQAFYAEARRKTGEMGFIKLGLFQRHAIENRDRLERDIQNDPKGPLGWMKPSNEFESAAFANQVGDELADMKQQAYAEYINFMSAAKKFDAIVPETGRARVYDAHDQGRLDELTPDERAYHDQLLQPMIDEATRIYNKLAERDENPQLDFNPQYIHRRMLNRTAYWREFLFGDQKYTIGGILRKSAGGLMKRKYFALQNDEGERLLVSTSGNQVFAHNGIEPGGTKIGGWWGLKTKGRTTAKNAFEQEIDKLDDRIKKLKTEQRHKSANAAAVRANVKRLNNISKELGELERERQSKFANFDPASAKNIEFKDDAGKLWHVGPATRQDIISKTQLKVLSDPYTTSMLNLIELRRAERASDFLTALKQKLIDNGVAYDSKAANAPYVDHKTWGMSEKVPALRGMVIPKKLATTLDDFYKDWSDRGDSHGMIAINRFLRDAIFFNPMIHIPNIATAWFGEKGATGWMPWRWPRVLSTGLQAIQSLKHPYDNPVLAELYKAGAPLEMGRYYKDATSQYLLQKASNDIARRPEIAKSIGKAVGSTPARVVKTWYNLCSKATWYSNDLFTIQAILEHKADGLSTKDAISRVREIMPDYRLPSYILGNMPGSRTASWLLRNPAFSMFGSYHYNMLHAWSDMARRALTGKNLREAKLDEHESATKVRARAFNHMLGFALLAGVILPVMDELAKRAIGDPRMQFRRSGELTFPYNTYMFLHGRMSWQTWATQVFTPAPATEAGAELLMNRDFFTGRKIMGGDVWSRSEEGIKYALNALAPFQIGSRLAEGSIGMKQAAQSLLGLRHRTPTEAERTLQKALFERLGTGARTIAQQRQAAFRMGLRRQAEDAQATGDQAQQARVVSEIRHAVGHGQMDPREGKELIEMAEGKTNEMLSLAQGATADQLAQAVSELTPEDEQRYPGITEQLQHLLHQKEIRHRAYIQREKLKADIMGIISPKP